MKHVSIIIFLLLIAGTCFSADYYFSQSTGNDSTGDGSESTPWQTITKINDTSFSAGDNIYLKAGDTWTIGSGESGIYVDYAGNSENEITITAYGTGAKPIIDASAQTGDGIRGNGAIEVCIYLPAGGVTYLTVDGIEVKAATDEMAFDGYNSALTYVTIKNCKIIIILLIGINLYRPETHFHLY